MNKNANELQKILSARRRTKLGKKGFTLVEILVTLGIIGVIIVMHQAVLSSTVLERDIKHRDIALRIVSHKMEELRATEYASLPGNGSFADPALSMLPSGSAAITVAEYNQKTKQVTLTVSWIEPNTGQRSVVLDTLITETGGL